MLSSSSEQTEAEVEATFSIGEVEEEEEEEDDDDEEEEEEDPTSSRKKKKKKKKKIKKKRRFSDEQVRSLETIFESETKLDPRKKVQVARDLGLQPRQVAIWFQNKRARWKSKELENNYRALKANYDTLKARFDHTNKEKESLLLQLQELQIQLEKFQGGNNNNSDQQEEDYADQGDRTMKNNINEEIFVAAEPEPEPEPEPSMVDQPEDQDIEYYCQGALQCSDMDDHSHRRRRRSSRNINGNAIYLDLGQGQGGDDPADDDDDDHLIPNMMDQHNFHSSLAAKYWCSFDSGSSLYDQSSTSSSHWWDSWT